MVTRTRILLSVVCVLSTCALAFGTGSINEPRANETIANRLDFPVSVSIQGYETDIKQRIHYWVSVALGHGPLKVHWPKYYVKTVHHAGRVHDGGQNPLPTRQAMTLLLLRVDDARNQQFVRWLEDGVRKGTWEGLPVIEAEIVARTPIFFP